MNATEEDIYTAIFTELRTITPAWKMKLPGIDFTPGADAYMRVTFLGTPEPDFAGFGDGRYTRNVRLVQVDCFYPKKEKRADLVLQQAQKVRALFWPTAHGRSIDAGASWIQIDREPVIDALMEGGASHLQVPVYVRFSTERGPV